MTNTDSSESSALVVRNSTVVILAQAIIRVTAVGFAIYISRRLGSEGYGLYSLVTSFVAVFSFPADFGLSTYTAREVARNRDRTYDLASNTAVLRLLLTPFVVFIALMSAWVLQYQPKVVTGVVLASLGFLIMAIQDTLEALFIGHERLWFTAVTDMTNRLVFMGIAIFALIWRSDYLMVIASLLIGNLAALLVSVMITNKDLGKIKIHLTPTQWPKILKASLPIAVLFISFSIALRFDTFVLKRYFGNTTVGWYSAAYDVIFGLFIVAEGIHTAVFATASRLAVHEPQRVTQLGQAAIKALVIISLPCAIGGYLVADELAVFIFGEQFTQTGMILRILLLTIPARFLVGLMNNISIALSRSWSAAAISCGSSILNVGLNIWLTPQFGPKGAALIALGCETFSMMLLFKALNDLQLLRYVKMKKWGILLVNFAMVVMVFGMPWLHLFVRISVGAFVYVISLISVRVLSLSEIKQLVQPFSSLLQHILHRNEL